MSSQQHKNLMRLLTSEDKTSVKTGLALLGAFPNERDNLIELANEGQRKWAIKEGDIVERVNTYYLRLTKRPTQNRTNLKAKVQWRELP